MTKITQWERACTHHVGVDGLVVPGGPQLPSEGAEVPAFIFSAPGDQRAAAQLLHPHGHLLLISLSLPSLPSSCVGSFFLATRSQIQINPQSKADLQPLLIFSLHYPEPFRELCWPNCSHLLSSGAETGRSVHSLTCPR